MSIFDSGDRIEEGASQQPSLLRYLFWGMGHLVLASAVACLVFSIAARLICDPYNRIYLGVLGFSLSLGTSNGLRSYIIRSSFSRSVITGFLTFVFTAFILFMLVEDGMGALTRGMQKTTMGHMREIATAIENLRESDGTFPTLSSIEALEEVSGAELPEMDGWSYPFLFRSDGNRYVIISPGQCGSFETGFQERYEKRQTTSYGADIKFENGTFIQYPEGTQD